MEIFESNGLYGLKDDEGKIRIPPQYRDFYSYTCGLACVRDINYHYAYIDYYNNAIVPFGRYIWTDPYFTCGYARVKGYSFQDEKECWGIINTLGDLIVPMKYDRIWTLNEKYFDNIRAYNNDKECRINLREFEKDQILDGLRYIRTYTIDEFKEEFNVSHIYVRENQSNSNVFFHYGTNIGIVSNDGYLTDPAISIVCNSAGKIFSLLHHRNNVGARRVKQQIKKKLYKTQQSYTRDYDSYNDYTDYLEGLRLDAFEGDESNYWNID